LFFFQIHCSCHSNYLFILFVIADVTGDDGVLISVYDKMKEFFAKRKTCSHELNLFIHIRVGGSLPSTILSGPLVKIFTACLALGTGIYTGSVAKDEAYFYSKARAHMDWLNHFDQ
jgi:hypothetical protein